MLDKILNQRALLTAFLIILIIGGISSFSGLSKLEDPEITVKAAVIATPYQGASADEVDQEVTDVIEKAIQKLEDIDYIESTSMPGMSMVTVYIEGYVTMAELPQRWDHLRRKVNDAATSLPQGAMAPIVNDDFGDVYGIFMAITNDGHTYKELDEYTEYLKSQLLLVDGVKRIEVVGQKTETVEIQFSPEQFATLGINPMSIVQTLNDQSSVTDAGSVVSGSERIRLNIGTKFQSLEEIRNLNISGLEGRSYFLGDIAEVQRSFMVPKRSGLVFNQNESLGLAISMESGDNIIQLGTRIDEKLSGLMTDIPVGIEVHKIYDQAKQVDTAISEFTMNLIESVGIVMAALLIALGFKAGLLVASSLVFTILGTFIVMGFLDMPLDKISLGAIVIAMGMLVDNAIVVAEGIISDLEKGMSRHKAFAAAARQNALPLIGATVIAILAFMPLAFNTTSAGEFMKPLFFVLAISLSLSWILAIIQVPFMATFFYKNGKSQKNKKVGNPKDIYTGPFYRTFGGIIRYALWHKSFFIIATLIILILSFSAFGLLNKDFFPQQDYDQFMVEYRLPQGSDISQVEADLENIKEELLQWEEIEQVITSLGSSPVRYTLSRPMNSFNPRYGELILNVKDEDFVGDIIARIESHFQVKYPNAQIRCRNYSAMGSNYKIQAVFSGTETGVLTDLAAKAKAIMQQEPDAIFVNDNWGNETKTLSPVYSPVKAQRLNITRDAMASSLAIATVGMPVGVYYENNTQMPLILKVNSPLSENPDAIETIPVWGQRAQASVPLSQIIDTLAMNSEYYQIYRYDGERSIKAQCEPAPGLTAPEVMAQFRADIENIPRPEGYKLEWHGEYKDSNTATDALLQNLPLALLLMALIAIGLFNNFRQPIIIFSIVPMAFIGIILGFMVTRLNFGFIAIVGGLGLIGMMIKNSVVLMDQINIEIKSGRIPVIAIIKATISRIRPVGLAAITTIFGMFPLLFDPMFQGMSVSIMFGLLIGTIITLLVVPVLYALFYKVDTSKLGLIGKIQRKSML
jgi:multidrug efflux pump subunit AcrB